jgi:hypothetical protein
VARTQQLGDVVKDLCARVLVAEGDEFDRLIVQLRQALRDHFVETRKLLVKSYPGLPKG